MRMKIQINVVTLENHAIVDKLEKKRLNRQAEVGDVIELLF